MVRMTVEFPAAFLGPASRDKKHAAADATGGPPKEVDIETCQGRRPDQSAYSEAVAVGSLAALGALAIVGGVGALLGWW